MGNKNVASGAVLLALFGSHNFGGNMTQQSNTVAMQYLLKLLLHGNDLKQLTSSVPFHRFNAGDEIKSDIFHLANKSPLFVMNVSHDFVVDDDGQTVTTHVMTLDLAYGSESLRQGFREIL